MSRVDAEWIERKRQEAGLTLSRMARLADLSTETVWRTVSGRTQPTKRVAEAIAGVLGVPVDCLYGHCPETIGTSAAPRTPPNGGTVNYNEES